MFVTELALLEGALLSPGAAEVRASQLCVRVAVSLFTCCEFLPCRLQGFNWTAVWEQRPGEFWAAD